jgi:hypothetical protein
VLWERERERNKWERERERERERRERGRGREGGREGWRERGGGRGGWRLFNVWLISPFSHLLHRNVDELHMAVGIWLKTHFMYKRFEKKE